MDESVNINALEQFLGDLAPFRSCPPDPPCVTLPRARGGLRPGRTCRAGIWLLKAGPSPCSRRCPSPAACCATAFRLSPARQRHRRPQSASSKLWRGILLQYAHRRRLQSQSGRSARSRVPRVLLAPASAPARSFRLKAWSSRAYSPAWNSCAICARGNAPAAGTPRVRGRRRQRGHRRGHQRQNARRGRSSHVLLEDREHMPAFEHNIKDAHRTRRDAASHSRPGPHRRQERKGLRRGISCVHVAVQRRSKFSPVLEQTQTVRIEADQIIFAIGQTATLPTSPPAWTCAARAFSFPALPCAPAARPCSPRADAVTGPRSVIQRIVGGRDAAHAMSPRLNGLLGGRRNAASPPRGGTHAHRQTAPSAPQRTQGEHERRPVRRSRCWLRSRRRPGRGHALPHLRQQGFHPLRDDDARPASAANCTAPPTPSTSTPSRNVFPTRCTTVKEAGYEQVRLHTSDRRSGHRRRLLGNLGGHQGPRTREQRAHGGQGTPRLGRTRQHVRRRHDRQAARV